MTCIVLLCAATLMISCGDDDGSPAPVNVNFNNTEVGLSGDNATVVSIVFSRAAESAGSLMITASSSDLVYGEDNDYYTEPATEDNIVTIPVSVGDTEISFSIAPGTALNIEEDKTISFLLSSNVESFMAGTNNTLTVTVSENFVTPSATVIAHVGEGSSRDQHFYLDLDRLETTTVNRNNYDLALESAGEGFNILLNASTIMRAAATDEADFENVTEEDLENASFSTDVVTGNSFYQGSFDETAFYNWDANGNTSNVYIVDRGIEASVPRDVDPVRRGYRKVQLTKSGDEYTIHSANLDGSAETTFTVNKSDDASFKYVHFNNGEAEIEPANWDILVRAVTYEVSSNNYSMIYNTLGAYHNYYGGSTVALIDISATEQGFEDVTLEQATEALNATDNGFNTIGVNWRDSNMGQYTINDQQVYIIQDEDGNIFKLHFTAYFSAKDGSTEAPEIQYEHLN
ncbi:HmuY family protein [Fulvivirga sediminis]|uniref:Calx-beta domain-containing protein n=1 Tax=Fulvivirga sediminis TaxID=2803949 RepID=A0A937F6A5_9BACT|nr:HmuY family protein [Fulvivirga sediminis]MBL3655816.1 hypothetical protein [Fulvivirga sediminis]